MIKKLKIQSYRCVRDVEMTLSPLHALIGPNDSGKSTILKAVADLGATAVGGNASEPHTKLLAVLPDGATYQYWSQRRPRVQYHEAAQSNWRPLDGALPDEIAREFSPVQIVRLDPDMLRQPSALIPDKSPLVLGSRGEGLPGVIDALISRGDETWANLRAEFRKLFPFATITLPRPNANSKTLGVRLDDGTEVGPHAMSEGMLYFLAFLVLAEIKRPAILLVEEPENGLHPSRIADVMRVLRAISEDRVQPAQVLIATHSPLVVNELQPHEVTVVTRDGAGTHVHAIAETPNFDKRRKVYELGELWLSYANGKDEAALLAEESAE